MLPLEKQLSSEDLELLNRIKEAYFFFIRECYKDFKITRFNPGFSIDNESLKMEAFAYNHRGSFYQGCFKDDNVYFQIDTYPKDCGITNFKFFHSDSKYEAIYLIVEENINLRKFHNELDMDEWNIFFKNDELQVTNKYCEYYFHRGYQRRKN